MTNEQCSYPHHIKNVTWSAILVGALVGIGLSFLLNIFSIAIGLSLVTTTKEGMATLAIGGFIGLIIGTFISMFMTGFTAGYLARPYCPKRNLGIVYGFTAWCVALILTILLAAAMSRYINFYSDFLHNPSIVTISTTSNNPSSATMVGSANKMATTVGMSSLLIFALFYIGAFASCLGGYFGISCRDDSCMPK